MADRARRRRAGGPGSRASRAKTPGELAADRAVRFISNLTLGSGSWAGQPFVLRPWQEHGIVRPLFGTLRPDGLRQIRTCFIGIPRKNGKTELIAALGLYLMMGDGEPAAEVYSAGADRDQAGRIFLAAANMVRADPELLDVCTIIESKKRIVHRPSNSFLQALSAEAYTKHGLNAHAVLFDELHAQPNRDLWDVLTTSQGARRQPLVVAITTAGFDRQSICYEVYRYAKDVLTGQRDDPTFLPIIYEAPEDADWTDERVWSAANPALGDFRSIDELRTKCLQARDNPGNENAFRQLYLNQWTEQHSRWLGLDLWDTNAAAGESLHPQDSRGWDGRQVWGGLDIGSVSDLTSLVWVSICPDAEGEDTIDVLHRSWVPEARLERKHNPQHWAVYREWVDAGVLIPTDGDTTDQSVILEHVVADAQRMDVARVHIDRLFQGQQLMHQLADAGIPVAPMAQTFLAIGPPMAALERRLRAQRVHHGRDPLLRFAFANVVVVRDGPGNQKIDKAKSQAKVDPMQALVMAMDAFERREPRASTMSVYAARRAEGRPLIRTL